MAVFELLLFVLFGLNFASMFSGFMLARRMGMYLMMQVMMLMLAMFLGLGALILGITGILPELLYFLVIGDLIFLVIAFLLEFFTVVPILMKTMQGAPMHSAHITNLIMSVFFTLAFVLFYADLALL
ncbi:MAG: DUF5400 family protein [Candidatus Thorarchaeota archaeon]